MSEAFDRAVADHRAGKFEAAARVYRQLLDDDPGHSDAWHLLGLTLHQRGRHDLAVQTIQRALLLNPRVANYHNSLGMALHGAGDADGAARALQTAVTIDAKDADAHNNLGMVYTDLRRFEEAERTLRKALTLRSDHQGAIYNLGRVLVWRGEDTGAVRYLREACTHDSNNPTYWNALGVALNHVHEFTEARDAFLRAMEIDPERVDPHVNFAHHLLSEGEVEAGWREHEWRLRRPEFKQRMGTQPWSGEDIEGKTILLWAEQGLGDAIQFVRYAAEVAACGARVIVEAPDTLHGLFCQVAGVSDVVTRGHAAAYDTHAALMSLPAIFGMSTSDVPYLRSTAGLDLGEPALRRVGLVWAGNPKHANDRSRSHRLMNFESLPREGNAFFALQVGQRAQDAAPAGLLRKHLGAGLENFSDTAAALAALHLLISVDTSVAHLAGAMGVPTWLILPSNPDWRWRRTGNSTAWYPSMRLFRQLPGEDDRLVFERLANALAVEQGPY